MHNGSDSDDSNDSAPVPPGRRRPGPVPKKAEKDLSELEKQSLERTRARNREAARKHREFVVATTASLEVKVEGLEAKNQELNDEISQLGRQKVELQLRLSSHEPWCQQLGVGGPSSSGAGVLALPVGHRGVSGSNSLVYDAVLSGQGFSSMQLQPVEEEQLQGTDLLQQLGMLADQVDSSGETASNSVYDAVLSGQEFSSMQPQPVNDSAPVPPGRRRPGLVPKKAKKDLSELGKQRLERRRARNRKAARNHRARAVATKASLMRRVEELEAKNQELNDKISQLGRQKVELQFFGLKSHEPWCQQPGVGVSSSSGAGVLALPVGHRGVSGSNSLVYDAGLSGQGFSSMQLQPVEQDSSQGVNFLRELADQLDLPGGTASNSGFANSYSTAGSVLLRSAEQDSSQDINFLRELAAQLDLPGGTASNSSFANSYSTAGFFYSARDSMARSESSYAAASQPVAEDEERCKEVEIMNRL